MSSDRSSATIRNAFMIRLNTKFFERLRTHSQIAGWSPTGIYDLASAIVNDSAEEIDRYLGARHVTLSNAGEAIEHIIDTILMPKVERLRI
jgi:hypothetical protein